MEIKNDILKNFVSTVTGVVEEAKVEVTEDGFELQAVNPAHTLMVEASIPKDEFETYDEDMGELRLNLDKIYEFLKLLDRDDIVDIELEEVDLILESGYFERKMRMLEEGLRGEETPDIEFKNELKVEGNQVKTAIKAVKAITDHIEIELDEEDSEIRFRGAEDEDEVELELGEDDFEEYDIEESAKSMYALDLMKSVRGKIGKEVEIRVMNDYPISIEWEKKGGKYKVLIAPRIESG